MSLLTDAELARAAYPALENVPSHWLTGRNRRVADAATEVALKAVAEWMDGKCDQMIHGSITLGQRLRRDCCYCMRDMAEFAREGKMPGEEK